uniref:Uncharacterized protein n=1 Tax=Arundo donax TaxID=35708 RepID=A0A0A8ZD65_ARUDO
MPIFLKHGRLSENP